MPLEVLEIENTQISDLAPLRRAPLKRLGLKGSPIVDVTPLNDLPLEWISIDVQTDQHEQFLRTSRGLKTINQLPANEFLKTTGS